jgi:hypothetical protein
MLVIRNFHLHDLNFVKKMNKQKQNSRKNSYIIIYFFINKLFY